MSCRLWYLISKNLYNDTFIVITSDHGMGAKGLMYEHGTRIMQIVRYQPLFDINSGGSGPFHVSSDFVVSNIDLAAVIFDIANITIPNQYILDGINWKNDVLALMNNSNMSDNNCCNYRFMDIYNSHTMVSSKYKYIYRANPDNIETDNDVQKLYNMLMMNNNVMI